MKDEIEGGRVRVATMSLGLQCGREAVPADSSDSMSPVCRTDQRSTGPDHS